MLGNVVHKQDFTPLGLDRKTVVRADAAFRGHERWIGQDHVATFVPALLAGQGIVFMNDRIRESVQVHIRAGQPDHVRRDVVPAKIGHHPGPLVGGEVLVLPHNMLEGRNEKARRAAGGIEDGLILLRVHDSNNEINNVARSSELSGIALRAENGKQVFKGVAEPFAVVVVESGDFFQEEVECFRIAVR